MLIRAFGLHWKRDEVYWNSASHNGRLLGVRVKAVTAGEVNFRDQVGVYVLYQDFQMVYAGQAGAEEYSLFKRLRFHTRDRLGDRWNRFSWFGLRAVEGGELAALEAETSVARDDALNQIEAVLITAAEPMLNHKTGVFGADAQQYIQRRDHEKLGPSPEEMIRDLWNGGAPKSK